MPKVRLVCTLALTLCCTLPAKTTSAQTRRIWMDPGDLAARPTSGAAWNNLLSAANQTCTTPNLANQEDPANVCVMAKALVYARTGQPQYYNGVAIALSSVVNAGLYNGRALALGRELAAYVIAADLINLKGHDPNLDASFRTV